MKHRYFNLFFRFFVLVIMVMTGVIHVHAQTKGAVQGTLENSEGEAVVFAKVIVYNPQDSVVLGGTYTDEEGQFELVLEQGVYLLRCEDLSFGRKWISDVKVDPGRLMLGTIVLETPTVELDNVQIHEEQNQMEFKLDKRVYNVSKDLTNIGSNAQEILENVPSVTVDVEGNVALRGSENVRILIDGKQSGLTGLKDQNALQQLQGNLIDRIEVITNPSAKYDAEGEAGIINIVLKKKKQKGLNGSFDLSAGYPENFGAGLNLNWRKKKINLFTNASLNYRDSPGRNTFYQEFTNDSGLTEIYQSSQVRSRAGLNGQFQLGTDIFLDKYNTITFAGLYQGSRGKNTSSIFYEDLNESGEVVSSSTRTDDELEPGTDIETTLNYTRKFPQKDRSWTVDLKYTLNNDTENNSFFQTFSDGSADLEQRGLNTEDQSSYLIQTDYYHPIGKKGKLETGLKGTLRNISNDFTVEELIGGTEWEALSNFDNELRYSENIYAGYAIYGNEFKKVSYQAGLRVEVSDIGTELVETAEFNDRQYANFFPSGALSYNFNEENQLQASYSRRISRPRFRHLLPFATLSNTRLIWQGNPDLDPELTDAYEVGYLRYFKKGSLLSSMYYRYGTNIIRRITTLDADGVANIFPVNLGFSNSYGLELSMNYDLFKWWQVTGNANFFRFITTGEYEGISYDADAIILTSQVVTKFTLPKQIKLQTSFNYRTPRNTTQGRRLAIYSWHFGANKRILKKKGTLAFSVRDILNSRKMRSITEGENFFTMQTFQWRQRQFTLSFNYQLNQNGQQKRRRSSGFEGGGEDF